MGGDQNKQSEVGGRFLNRKNTAGDPVQKNGKHVVQLAVHEKGSVKIQGGPLLAISRGPELRLWGLQPQLPILRPFIGGLFHPIYN